MDFPECTVRRANVDDLPGLKLLWERAHLQVLDLEKHLTDFQLAATSDGDLLGAVALQIDGKLGRLHSEAFTRPELADFARPWLWQRIQTLARNHGLQRLWTREKSPFWHQAGFIEPDLKLAKSIPSSFGNPHTHWLTLALREDNALSIAIAREFELFQQTQRANTESVLARARRMKIVANLLALLITAMAVAGLILVFSKFHRNSSPVGPLPRQRAE